VRNVKRGQAKNCKPIQYKSSSKAKKNLRSLVLLYSLPVPISRHRASSAQRGLSGDTILSFLPKSIPSLIT